MPEIRYWDSQALSQKQSSTSPSNKTGNKTPSDIKLFQSLMMEKLINPLTASSRFDLGLNNTDMTAMFDDSGLLGNNFSALEDKLTNIKNQGMGKVWAAKLSSQLPIFDQNNDEKKPFQENGLNNMIMLSVQEQMIKARKVLEKQLNASNPVSASSASQSESLSEFIRNIQAQIRSASKQFDLSETDIKQQL